jgi:hypothetical protein
VKTDRTSRVYPNGIQAPESTANPTDVIAAPPAAIQARPCNVRCHATRRNTPAARATLTAPTPAEIREYLYTASPRRGKAIKHAVRP